MKAEIKEKSKKLNEKINDFYQIKELASRMDSITSIKTKLAQEIIQLDKSFHEKRKNQAINLLGGKARSQQMPKKRIPTF